ncbi:hypothetical protein TUM17386_36010 [Shewanella algae]|nr:hypothetical protein TUM17386_36010 [Shewanella algae]
MKITTIGLDIAKLVFHAVAVNKAGKLVRKKMLKRKEVLGFFAKLEPCLVAIEACGGAHYWNREITALGHQVKLILLNMSFPIGREIKMTTTMPLP